MAFEDRVEVVSVEGGRRMRLPSPERAAHRFARRPHISARVVWVNPDPAASSDETSAA